MCGGVCTHAYVCRQLLQQPPLFLPAPVVFNDVFSFSLVSMHFLISFFISPLIQWLFSNVLFNSLMFVKFPGFRWLSVSSFTLL